MKKLLVIGFVVLVVGGAGYWLLLNRQLINPHIGKGEKIELPLDKYDFDNLKKRGGTASEISIVGNPGEVEKRRTKESVKELKKLGVDSKVIKFRSNGKWISGMMNYTPTRSSLSPVVIMIRGYAEKAGYYPGSGSWRVADELAKQGYVTVSLDFLGYGLSDEEATDPMEARFEKVISVMDLVETVKATPWVDKSKIGIWAHSNGGQIALSFLEVSSGRYPTVMWAPMTSPFPQSLIDTADEGEARQKAIDYVNVFLKHYDGRRYAFENYYEWVRAPVEIEQGTADPWCKVEWQEKVVNSLKLMGKTARLNLYKGDDHNLSKNWETAVERTGEFFEINLRH